MIPSRSHLREHLGAATLKQDHVLFADAKTLAMIERLTKSIMIFEPEIIITPTRKGFYHLNPISIGPDKTNAFEYTPTKKTKTNNFLQSHHDYDRDHHHSFAWDGGGVVGRLLDEGT